MSKVTMDSLEYYAHPGPMTDPRDQADLFRDLPTAIPALCQVVQGVLLHIFWAEQYGVKLSEERKQEVNIRPVAQRLARIRQVNRLPLVIPRLVEERQVGNCRDFSTLLCAMLRYQGVPARARCGFGKYFVPEHFEDHWVCEYWKADELRWVMVDPQLDALQRKVLQINFDPCDMPPGQFLPGGQAWQLCRSGQADPDHFGISDMHGLWFVRGDLLRDLASLNKMELLPWDCWGLIEGEDKNLSADDMALLDRVAALTRADNSAFAEMRALYENDKRLCVPNVVKSYSGSGVQIVDLASLTSS
jgi:hypothetical protein